MSNQKHTSLYLKSNWGSVQAFRLIVKGSGLASDTYVGNVQMSFQSKPTNPKK